MATLVGGNLLFRKGFQEDLDKITTKVNGVWYFTVDNGKLHIDYQGLDNQLYRKTINAEKADYALALGEGKATLSNSITNSTTSIPTGQAVKNALDTKMNKNNPTGTGIFTMNSGNFSIAENGNVSIKGASNNASPEIGFKETAHIVYDSSKNAFNFVFN